MGQRQRSVTNFAEHHVGCHQFGDAGGFELLVGIFLGYRLSAVKILQQVSLGGDIWRFGDGRGGLSGEGKKDQQGEQNNWASEYLHESCRVLNQLAIVGACGLFFNVAV